MKNVSIIGFALSVCMIVVLSFNCGEKAMTSEELLSQADEQFKSRDYEGARVAYDSVVAAAVQENNNSVLTEAYSQIARCYIIAGDLEQGSQWLDKAEKIAKADEPDGWSRFLGVRGRLEWQEVALEKGELTPVVKKAAETFKEMYSFCLDQKLFSRAIDAAHMVAIVGGTDERIEWGEKGIKAAEEGKITDWLGPLWNNHGWNLNEMGEYNKSLEALINARRYHHMGQNELSKLVADWSVGHAYRMTNQLDSALSWMTGVHDWANTRYLADSTGENAEWIGFANQELGEIALAEKRLNEALDHFNAAKIRLEEAEMPQWDKKGFEELTVKISELENELK
ncbi:MAG: hypothetical protein GY839_08750 [candidate division Zixibacteria bacterium]|nr:hypothetical protein [candidate division Zixibacteria bacterium]